MFEQNGRDYPAALAGGPEHGEQGLLDAIGWVLAQGEVLGGTVYIFAPGVANVRDNRILGRFAKTPGVVTGTWKSGGAWSGGPVLAAWPSRDKLGEIADDHRTHALVVVPWDAGAVDAWAAAVAPERLGSAAHTDVAIPELDPVVIEGLKHLTLVVNHANNLAGSMDKRDAIGVLRLLRKGGYRLPPEPIYAWALANGWPARGAERLRELAQKFEAGIAVRGGQSPALRPSAVAEWRRQGPSIERLRGGSGSPVA